MTFKDLVNGPTGIVHLVDTSVIPLLYALAFIFFLIGIVRFFFSPSAEAQEKGRAFVIWALIGFVVLFGVWGIVRLLLTTLSLGG